MESGDLLAGKYRLIAPLGQGAMGVVWRAHHVELEREVAVKLLHANLAADPDARARFVREARVAATLDHPNAVRVLDFGEAATGLYLVMELVAGATLRAWLDDERVSRDDAVAITLAIAQVLAAAHEINLVHRDIKPENTFVDRRADGLDVRVVDFGLAFIVDAGPSIGRLTDEGILGGTPAYMSPEQARGRAVGPASDVYSLGCVLYEMLAGRPPFIGPVVELLTRHAYAPPLTLRELEISPPVAPAIERLALAMLSKSPPLRPTAAAVVTELVAASAVSTHDSLRLRHRSERALAPATVAVVDDATALAVAVDGALTSELGLALAAAGVRVVDDPQTALAVYAPGAALDRLRTLTARPTPVITDVAVGDWSALADLVRIGCHDAVTRPVEVDGLVRKLQRLAARRGRSQRGAP